MYGNRMTMGNRNEHQGQRGEQLQKQVQGSKLKLIQMLDRLDTGDKHYTRKYQDM